MCLLGMILASEDQRPICRVAHVGWPKVGEAVSIGAGLVLYVP